MTKRRPLEHIKVLANDQYIAGPCCSMILADVGAEIIKVERPPAGDPRRTMGPFVEVDGQKHSWGFAEYNRNKKSISLDLTKEEARAIFKELACKCDVVVENFRPGVMDRLGVGYSSLKEVNPRLIYCAISGFGQLEGYQGPYSSWPAFDIVAEAMSGFLNMVGFEDRPPVSALYGLADIQAGQTAALGIMMALIDRERTGQGQMVDISMLDAMTALAERVHTIYSFTGQNPTRGPDKLFGPRGSYKTKDGYLAINIPSDYMWDRMTKAIGREDLVKDPRCVDGASRASSEDFIRPIIEEWLKDKGSLEAATLLNQFGVPSGPVHTAEDVFTCEQIKARGMLIPVEEGPLKGRTVVKTPVLLSESPEVRARNIPSLGEHTKEVLVNMLGVTEERIRVLQEQGVIK